MLANIYIDGFNFYYRAVRNTPYKWLDYSALVKNVYKGHTFSEFHYFTAHVKPYDGDKSKVDRQNVYLRALKTIPGLSVHFGKFQTHPAMRPLAHPVPGGPSHVEILDTKEKGSDVNLASQLLVDGFLNKYELAIVITNDSDLAEPIRMTRDILGRTVFVLDPQDHVSKILQRVSSGYKNIRTWMLSASQFPEQIQDSHGVISRPPQW